MKKKLIVLLLAIFCATAYSQKGKKIANTSSVKKTTLAKTENITADLIQKNSNTEFYLLVSNKGKTDSLLIKTIASSGDKAIHVLPVECKITPFTAKGVKLYSISWNEKTTSGDIKTKLENTTNLHTEIWDIANKTVLFSNIQTTKYITEILYLDQLKMASQTSEKIQRAGFELTLTPVGDIVLKNKTQENKLIFEATEKKYVSINTPASKVQPKKK